MLNDGDGDCVGAIHHEGLHGASTYAAHGVLCVGRCCAGDAGATFRGKYDAAPPIAGHAHRLQKNTYDHNYDHNYAT